MGMGYFMVSLSSGQQAEVRWGKVKKKQVLNIVSLFKKKGITTEERIGYIVKVQPGTPDQKEYRLLKTKEGEWLTKEDSGFLPACDELSMALEKAIDEYEKSHNPQ
jgi:hypothetical protein